MSITTAFFIIPTEATEPDEDWDSLGRGARLERLLHRRDALDAQIRSRLHDMDIEYLKGMDGWTVRSERPANRDEVIQRLQGLPLSVAPDERFNAL